MRLKRVFIYGVALTALSQPITSLANPFAAPAPAATSQGPALNARTEDALFERFIDRLNREQQAGRIDLGIGELAEGTVNPEKKEVTPEDVLKNISYVGTFSGRHVYRSEEEGCYIHEIQVKDDETKIIESRCFERTAERMRNSTE